MNENIEQPENKLMSALNQIMSGNTLNNSSNTGFSSDELKDVESLKLILGAILNDATLESLTNLEPEELDDINDAFYLNEYFDNPRIDIFIIHRLKLSRSKVNADKINNLLNIFAEISGKGLRNITDINTKGIFGNRFK